MVDTVDKTFATALDTPAPALADPTHNRTPPSSTAKLAAISRVSSTPSPRVSHLEMRRTVSSRSPFREPALEAWSGLPKTQSDAGSCHRSAHASPSSPLTASSQEVQPVAEPTSSRKESASCGLPHPTNITGSNSTSQDPQPPRPESSLRSWLKWGKEPSFLEEIGDETYDDLDAAVAFKAMKFPAPLLYGTDDSLDESQSLKSPSDHSRSPVVIASMEERVCSKPSIPPPRVVKRLSSKESTWVPGDACPQTETVDDCENLHSPNHVGNVNDNAPQGKAHGSSGVVNTSLGWGIPSIPWDGVDASRLAWIEPDLLDAGSFRLTPPRTRPSARAIFDEKETSLSLERKAYLQGSLLGDGLNNFEEQLAELSDWEDSMISSPPATKASPANKLDNAASKDTLSRARRQRGSSDNADTTIEFKANGSLLGDGLGSFEEQLADLSDWEDSLTSSPPAEKTSPKTKTDSPANKPSPSRIRRCRAARDEDTTIEFKAHVHGSLLEDGITNFEDQLAELSDESILWHLPPRYVPPDMNDESARALAAAEAAAVVAIKRYIAMLNRHQDATGTTGSQRSESPASGLTRTSSGSSTARECSNSSDSARTVSSCSTGVQRSNSGGALQSERSSFGAQKLESMRPVQRSKSSGTLPREQASSGTQKSNCTRPAQSGARPASGVQCTNSGRVLSRGVPASSSGRSVASKTAPRRDLPDVPLSMRARVQERRGIAPSTSSEDRWANAVERDPKPVATAPAAAPRGMTSSASTRRLNPGPGLTRTNTVRSIGDATGPAGAAARPLARTSSVRQSLGVGAATEARARALAPASTTRTAVQRAADARSMPPPPVPNRAVQRTSLAPAAKVRAPIPSPPKPATAPRTSLAARQSLAPRQPLAARQSLAPTIPKSSSRPSLAAAAVIPKTNSRLSLAAAATTAKPAPRTSLAPAARVPGALPRSSSRPSLAPGTAAPKPAARQSLAPSTTLPKPAPRHSLAPASRASLAPSASRTSLAPRPGVRVKASAPPTLERIPAGATGMRSSRPSTLAPAAAGRARAARAV
ncbi:hypothetical protein CC85DRAFT_328883 [Cutaneotrichosporon oleaginosum]|uniref:Uncharacterized protein n=1 Tax=Cutaneotrichosporon oleaginosum TaxID=879819 RepID=A0A0J0XKJ0_9TREE|nr:uncharacterized protein CC85DRAFT_328883 [Cutaneotrichosporon oleaginosum]KLT41621.1 hypothetical protein CC85DRAFT_328883 [Cutaneotrichosporon oleaginosum]TXT08140.1 hypothetical protein COLE_05064 [Cutaneotrichosporon oleaginosum]